MVARPARGLLDTSVFIASETGRRLTDIALPREVAVSTITIGELRAGVLAARDAATRDRRLRTYLAASALAPLVLDTAVAEAWALLRVALRDAGQVMGVNDSWIAATAIAHDVPLVTQDERIPAVSGLVLHKV